jgi:hypothetical protein
LAGHCRFIHPDEDAWEWSTSSVPPPPSFLHREDNDDDDDRPSSPVKRHTSGSRRNSLDSPSSDVYRPLPKGPKRRTSTRHESPPLRDTIIHSRRSRSPAGSASSRDPGPSRRSTDPNRIALGSGSSQRDEKRPMEPLAPPPPLPPPPSIVTGVKPTSEPTPNKEPPAAEKREVWLERIK